jgi:haloalkane dehalogenase
MSSSISTDFPFHSKYISVHGSKMHYIDEGSGDPILFIHGNPTSSYLWRNIIPYVTPLGRAIAPDLIGMGKSDKPDLDYRYHDQYKYIEGFMKALDLKNITLVLHDWGSGLGFNLAAQNPDRIKAIAFMEAMVLPRAWSDFTPDLRVSFRMMRTRLGSWLMVSVANIFIKQMLQQLVVRKLTKAEKEYYGEPYQTIASRKPLRQWPLELPIDGKPADVHDIVVNYNQWLQQTDMPKLLFYVADGVGIGAEALAWCRQYLSNLTVIDAGAGIHFIQEDNPHLIGEKLAEWVVGIEEGAD